MPYVFNILGKKHTHTLWTLVCVQVSMYGLKQKKTHKLWSFVSKCPCMDCSFLQNTTSVAIFWYSWYFCGYFVYLQPHKTDSHTGKKTPTFMNKSSHKTPFCGSGHTDAATQNPIATQEKAPKFMDKSSHKTPFCGSVRPSLRLSVCHTFFHYVPIIVSSWNFLELLPMTKVRSIQKLKVRGQGHRGQNPT